MPLALIKCHWHWLKRHWHWLSAIGTDYPSPSSSHSESESLRVRVTPSPSHSESLRVRVRGNLGSPVILDPPSPVTENSLIRTLLIRTLVIRTLEPKSLNSNSPNSNLTCGNGGLNAPLYMPPIVSNIYIYIPQSKWRRTLLIPSGSDWFLKSCRIWVFLKID